ncbi:hypothetical protein A3I58_01325 [Candidatus Peregrinibacteria bacterium RIFCSPLOWO2_02_FULL_39_10]|nr:MAG: hypothetical protein A3I58_01325 [Candidatus Peregrinibacteria bacterium RIFCSPLOWO2_02_FULL_39_10]
MLTPGEGRALPDYIKAIIDTIPPQDGSLHIIVPIGFVLNYLEGRGGDPAQAIASLRASLGQDADVLLEWLGIKSDETDGVMKVSMREGTDLDGIEARLGRFENSL